MRTQCSSYLWPHELISSMCKDISFHNSPETLIGGEGKCLDGFSSGHSSQIWLLLQAGDDCSVVSEKSTQIATPELDCKEAESATSALKYVTWVHSPGLSM